MEHNGDVSPENILHIHVIYITYIYVKYIYAITYIHYIYVIYRCPRRNGPNFGRVFLMLKYTDITQNTYIQS